MGNTLELYNALVELDIETESVNSVINTDKEMADLNREQFEAGVSSEGKKISPKYRSKAYAELKNEMNPSAGMWNPDLILTGAFIQSISVENITKDGFTIEASDSKSEQLSEKYGDEIFGLVSTQQEYYNKEVFFPDFSAAITQKTGLEFS